MMRAGHQALKTWQESTLLYSGGKGSTGMNRLSPEGEMKSRCGDGTVGRAGG